VRKSPKTVLLLYVLLGYVVLQFVWWAYLIYDLNVELIDAKLAAVGHDSPQDRGDDVRRQLTMILGEGTVFLSLLLVGAYYIRKFILREHRLAKQERNFLLATTHEFNSPIAAIRLNLQTLAKRTLNEAQKTQIISGAINASHRLESLVSNLLIASRIDAGKFDVVMERFDINLLIHNVIERSKPIHVNSGGDVVLMKESDEYIIEADKRAMELIAENLISNAIKYAPGKDIVVRVLSKSNRLTISFEDSGAGIPVEERKNIFNKFYRIENEETRSQKGTGLGLFLVKELVIAQGGEILFKPNKKQGAIFEINFEIDKS
jgi:two-component system phosphate regulon sensor histidine kinase PhoR